MTKTKLPNVQSVKTAKRNENIAAYIFLAPTLLGVLIFMVYPIIEGLRMSFFKTNGTIETFVGLENYQYVLTNDLFLKAIFNTFFIAFFQLIIAIPLAFVIAVFINSINFGKNFLKSVFFLPYITPAVAAATVFLYVVHPEGILNEFIGWFGIEPVLWLSEATSARFAAVFLGVWRTLGFNIIIFLAYLQAISPEYYEAAYVDGCTRLKSHLYITIPQMSGAFAFLIVMGWIQGLQRFTDVYVIGGETGSPANALYTIVGFIYQRGFGTYEFGISSAASYVLFVIIMIFTMINMKLTKLKV